MGIRLRKKWLFTWAVFFVGAVLAWKAGSSLGDYTAFATLILGVACASDVTDKKLNGAQ
jgi:hypothetical protein